MAERFVDLALLLNGPKDRDVVQARTNASNVADQAISPETVNVVVVVVGM